MTNQITTVEDILSDENFLAWYFKSDEKQAALWSRWLQQNANAEPVVMEAIAYLDQIHLVEQEVPLQQADAAFAKLEHVLNNTQATGATIIRKRFSWLMPAIAATVLLMAGYIFFKSGSEDGRKTKMGSSYGQISQYQLPDGSDVLLNANSTVTMNKSWKEGTDREVWVEGEAFFHVQKTVAKNKFVVHAKDVDIIVTGTRFNVINTEKETSVLLTEGSVTLVTKEGREIKMKPGEFVSVEKNNPEKKPANEEKILAWKQQKLVFENSKMTDVAAIIQQHYGLAVTLAEDIKDRTVTGIMPNNNLDVLLQTLEATNDFKITRTGKSILISKPQ